MLDMTSQSDLTSDPDQTQPPVDEWSGRAHEPYPQEATVNRYHYDSHEQLRAHLADFVTPTTSLGVSRSSKGSCPMSTSATPGQKNLLASSSTRSSKCLADFTAWCHA